MSDKYTEKLEFSESLSNSLPGKYLKNIRLMIMLLITVSILGVYSLLTLSKTLSPEVNVPYFVITTVLPGGTPEDIESLVTVPIEKEIKRIKEIDTFSSSSQENVSVITIEFDANADPQDARNDLQTAVDTAKTDLPSDAQEPSLLQLDFEDTPVWTFAVHKKDSKDDPISLMRLSTLIRDSLEDLSKIGRVEISGYDEREIHVLISPERISDYDVDIFTVMSSIQDALKSYPAGKITTQTTDFSVVINQPATTLEELREIPVKINGTTHILKEFADISEKSVPDQYPSLYKNDGNDVQPVVVFSVYKTTGDRIDEAQEEAENEVNLILEPYLDNYEVISVNNYAQEIDDQLFSLGENFLQTLGLVFLSMFLLYGIRQSFIASLSIPFTLLIIFASMQVFDFSLNFLSIYSLLIGLGLFTDNAVVIIEGFTSIYKSGKFTPKEAALLTFRDYSTELFSINLLTVWSFLPLLIMRGIMGEFIKPLPILVSVAMMASVLIALFFTLPSMMLFTGMKIPKRVKVLLKILGLGLIIIPAIIFIPKTYLFVPTIALLLILLIFLYSHRSAIQQKFMDFYSSKEWTRTFSRILSRILDKGLINLDYLREKYQKGITTIIHNKNIRRKILWILGIFMLFSYILVPLGFVKAEFFPQGDSDRLYISVELPLGTSVDVSEIRARELLDAFSQNQDVEFVTAEIGNNYSSTMGITRPDANEVLFTLFLTPENERDSSIEIAQNLRNKYINYEYGKVNVFNGETGGPPAGSDIDIQISGEDLQTLQLIADDISDYLNTLEGSTNIEKNIKEGKSKYVFKPDTSSLIKHQISESTIGFWLRTYTNGFNVTSYNFDTEEKDIVIRVNSTLITPEELSGITIPVNSGNDIPLNELGEFRLEPNPNIIPRKDGDRTISVTANVEEGFNAPELNQKLGQYVENELDLPDGYTWQTGGSNEMMNDANEDIGKAMVIAAVLILGTMVVQLGSFRKALLVMLVIPLAISGVFIFFSLTGTPLSLPATMGVLSLFGIVIANSLMIIEKVQKNLDVGIAFKDAIPEAATSRIEPILLTSASQVIGLIPATLADPIWRGFGGAIISGLSFSGIIMLFFIPVMYWIMFPEMRSAENEN